MELYALSLARARACAFSFSFSFSLSLSLSLSIYILQRDLPPEEHRRKFEDMRRGAVEEGAAVLRMRGDFASDNPAMWDPVLYRIKRAPHPRTGAAWCVITSFYFPRALPYQPRAAPAHGRRAVRFYFILFFPRTGVARCVVE